MFSLFTIFVTVKINTKQAWYKRSLKKSACLSLRNHPTAGSYTVMAKELKLILFHCLENHKENQEVESTMKNVISRTNFMTPETEHNKFFNCKFFEIKNLNPFINPLTKGLAARILSHQNKTFVSV